MRASTAGRRRPALNRKSARRYARLVRRLLHQPAASAHPIRPSVAGSGSTRSNVTLVAMPAGSALGWQMLAKLADTLEKVGGSMQVPEKRFTGSSSWLLVVHWIHHGMPQTVPVHGPAKTQPTRPVSTPVSVPPAMIRSIMFALFGSTGAKSSVPVSPETVSVTLTDTLISCRLHDAALFRPSVMIRGRSYRAAGLMAMWFAELGLVQVYDLEGNMLRTINLFEEQLPARLCGLKVDAASCRIDAARRRVLTPVPKPTESIPWSFMRSPGITIIGLQSAYRLCFC